MRLGFISYSRRFQRQPHVRAQLKVSVCLLLHTLVRSSTSATCLASASPNSFSVTPGFSYQLQRNAWFQLQHTVSASRLASASANRFSVTPGFNLSVQFQLLAWFQLQRSVSASCLVSTSALTRAIIPSISHTKSEFQYICIANSTPVSFDTTSGIPTKVSPSLCLPPSCSHCCGHDLICSIRNRRHGCDTSTTGSDRCDPH